MSGDPKDQAAKLMKLDGGRVATHTLYDQLVVADMLLKAGTLPTGITTKAQAWVLLQAGAENGLGPIAATRWLYIQPKSNKVEWTAEGSLAQARRSGLLASVKHRFSGEYPQDDFAAVCQVVRKDQPEPITATFSVGDAKRAGLWHKKTQKGNDSNWVTWDREMLMATAQRRAIRLAVPECLGGIAIRGESRGERMVSVGEDLEMSVEGVEVVPVEKPPKDPFLEDVVEVDAGTDAYQDLMDEAIRRAGDDEAAKTDLLAHLVQVHEAEGIAGAQKALREHEVFGDSDQAELEL